MEFLIGFFIGVSLSPKLTGIWNAFSKYLFKEYQTNGKWLQSVRRNIFPRVRFLFFNDFYYVILAGGKFAM